LTHRSIQLLNYSTRIISQQWGDNTILERLYTNQSNSKIPFIAFNSAFNLSDRLRVSFLE